MPRLTMVRYTTKPDRAEENEALSRAVYDELRANAPAHIAYALFRSGEDFVHLFINTEADSSDAVTELPAFKLYARDIADRCVVPPESTRLSLDLVEAYGLET